MRTTIAPPTPSPATGLAALTTLADYVHAISFEHLPAEVIDHSKRLLLEGISWMVMGARRDEARRLIQVQPETASAVKCTIIGTDRTASLLDAVRLNSALTQVHDGNDGRRLARRDGGSNHPGRGVIPVALSLGQHYHLSGKALIELMVLGYELVSRVRVLLPDLEYSYGAAAMLSRTLQFEPSATRRAFALAHCSFPMQGQWSTDSDFDFLRLGLITGAAVSAASWASADLSLPLDRCQFELTRNFPNTDRLDARDYAMMAVYIKPYPCCRALHPVIDIALALRATEQFAASEIATVEVRVGNTKEFQFQPVSPHAHYKFCEFSIPYTTACALIDGTVNESSFTRERISRSVVQELQQRITVTFDPNLQYNPHGPASLARPAVLALTTMDGRRYRRSTLFPKGSPSNPLTADELLSKFRAWTTPSFTDAQQDRVIDRVEQIETLPDVGTLVSSLATPRLT